ncbi:MAG: hypothetical protein DRH93_20510 [Deltaproteobacteria bacterium]|nr:MAG: hypothetical protein DRH93_20510 [Deltaproteobacteria bacterium]
MISRDTVKALDLKPITRDMCYDFYVKITSEFKTPEAIKEAVSSWQDDSKKINHLWWVLNYHSDNLDTNRELRAFIERHLDNLAQDEKTSLEE